VLFNSLLILLCFTRMCEQIRLCIRPRIPLHEHVGNFQHVVQQCHLCCVGRDIKHCLIQSGGVPDTNIVVQHVANSWQHVVRHCSCSGVWELLRVESNKMLSDYLLQ